MSDEDTVVAIIGLNRARTLAQKRTWMFLALQLENHHDPKRARRAWWDNALRKRVPVLSAMYGGSHEAPRGGRAYGAASDYGRNFEDGANALTPAEYHRHFRFAREHIPPLVRALRMPDKVTTKSRCSTTGEEALLVFLKRMTYPARGNDLIGFFRRCEGWISEVVQACLEHLLPIAEKLVKNFDHVRVKPLMEMFANALRNKGCPTKNVFGFLDGTFREFCRPSLDGYRGPAQKAQYSGTQKKHGFHPQATLTPGRLFDQNGLAHMPGRNPDVNLLNPSGLFASLASPWFKGCGLDSPPFLSSPGWGIGGSPPGAPPLFYGSPFSKTLGPPCTPPKTKKKF
eukprot:FR738081.1.p1 GENE.FR738081.1~~FR738081.1.p1  ORF type:complete len:342 (+),score=65.67 FR738081.1:121-1146(+)